MADDDSLKSDVDRNRDDMYRILTSRSSTELDKVLAAVVALIQERTSHPVSMSVLASIDNNLIVKKAIFLAAMHAEDDIKRYVLDRTDVCADTVSEYLHERLPKHVRDFTTGLCSLDYFVCTAIVDYVTT